MSFQNRIVIQRFLLITALTFITMPFQNCGKPMYSNKNTELSSIGGGNTITSVPLVPLKPLAGEAVRSTLNVAGSCETGAAISIQIDSTAAGSAVCSSGLFSLDIALTIIDGSHIVKIAQLDSAGKTTSAQINFIKDTVAPAPQILSPAPNANLLTAGVNVSGTCETGLSVNLAGGAPAAPVSAPCVNGNFQAQITVASPNRADAITASQTDSAGNTGSTSRAILIALNSTAPAIKISNPAANFVTKNGITLTGSCVSGLPITVAGSGVSAPTQAICSNSQFTTAVAFSSGDGLKNVTVAQTSAQNLTGQDSRSFILDTTAPAIVILAPAAGTQSPTGVTISGNCETGLPIMVSGTGTAAVTTVACTAAMFQANVTFSLNAGPKSVSVSQTDAAGNIATNSRIFERIALPAPNGALLYANNCAGCHAPLATSTKLNKTWQQIRSAITTQPPMQAINLTDVELQAIAAALVYSSPTPTIPMPALPSGTVRIPLTADNLYKPEAFGPVPMRRLSRRELRNSLLDVLTVDPGTMLNSAPPDVVDEKLNVFDNDSIQQNASPSVVGSYDLFAETYAAQFVNKSTVIQTLAGCVPTRPDDSACFQKFAGRVGRLLLRRPLTAAELTNFSNKLMPYALSDNNFNVAASLLIQYFVQNPEFLYRIEAGTAISNSTLRALNNYEIATRMSYLIWGSAPDAALMDAAASGQLVVASGRLAQANRMLLDNRARNQWRNYHAQWLGYSDVIFPSGYAADMTSETDKLVDQIAFDTPSAWMQIFQYNQTWVTPKLAQYYGMSVPAMTGWVPYTGVRGGGILSHGRFLLQGAKFNDTSPTMRGYRILKRVLCQKFGPLPAGVDATQPPPGPAGACKPQIYTMRTQAACTTCHGLTDGIGFGLENFSAGGQFRTSEPGLPSCTISGDGNVDTKPFNGPAQLGEIMSKIPVAEQCAARQLLKFALGRTETSADQNTIEAMHSQLTKTPSLKSMILSLVESQAMAHK